MKQYEISDYHENITILSDGKIISAQTGRKALDIYFKAIGFTGKVKVSSSNDVHFKVTPIVFENGRKYEDRRNGQRPSWYKIIYLN